MSDSDSDGEDRTAHLRKESDDYIRGVLRDKHDIFFDEPEDLPVGAGDDEYPSPVDYLLASLVGCQVSVLNQCLHKSRIEDFTIEADARIPPEAVGVDTTAEEMPNHTANRIEHVEISLTVQVPEEYAKRAERCLEVYDEGCIVGRSFKAGINYTPTTSLEVTE